MRHIPNINYDASGNQYDASGNIVFGEFYSNNCANNCSINNNLVVIYKPNNHKFSIQGAVSSSSRIDKLKLDTINKNKASLKNLYN